MDLTAGWRAVVIMGVMLVGACGDFVRYSGDAESVDAAAAPPAECPFRPASSELDYDAYDALLAQSVELDGDGNARIDYGTLESDGSDTLEAALLVMACADPQPGDLAFWINAYNASVLRGVLERRRTDPGFRPDAGGFAFFGERVHHIAGLVVTLDEIEHAVIRGQPDEAPAHAGQLEAFHAQLWGDETADARIHMALNCAARSCPNLRAGAYTVEAIEEQLAEAARMFLDNPTKGAGPDGVSSLFDWFADDFVASSGSVGEFIESWRTDGLADVDTTTFIEYDWALNEQ